MAIGEPEAKSTETSISLPVDLIRTVAIFLVILLHAAIEASPTVDIMSQQGVQLWWASNIYNSVSRVSVPLFVLLTGALLLKADKVNEPLKVFFKKRWNRVGIPILFWSLIFLLWSSLVKGQMLTPLTGLQGLLAGPYVHFWYVYALLGLYLITPLFRVVVAYAKWEVVKYFVAIWFIGTAIIPLLTLYASISPQAVWFADNVFILTGLAGYFFVGAYIEKIKVRAFVLYLGLVLSTIWTMLGTYLLVGTIGEFYGPFFLDASSVSVLVASLSLFLILSRLNTKALKNKKLVRHILRTVSENTLPIYLFHIIVLETLQNGYLGIRISVLTLNPFIEIPLIAVLTFAVSIAVVVSLGRLPFIKRIIG